MNSIEQVHKPIEPEVNQAWQEVDTTEGTVLYPAENLFHIPQQESGYAMGDR